MSSWNRFGWLFLLIIFFSRIGHGQSMGNLPKLLPSRIQPFQDEAFFPNYCVENIIVGSDGRLWMPTCGALTTSFNLPLLQYDGYELRPVDMALQTLSAQQTVYFGGYLEGLGLYGCINSAWESHFFSYAPSQGHAVQIPIPEGKTGAIHACSKDQIWFFQLLPTNKTVVYFWDGTQMVKEAEISTVFDTDGKALHPFPGKTVESGGFIYFQWRSFNLIRYHIKSKTLSALPAFQPTTSTSSRPCPGLTNMDRVHIAKDEHFIYTTQFIYNRVYLAKWDHQTEKWYPIIENLGCVQGAGIFEDLSGNILFHYISSNQKNETFLLDTKGNVWDYSAITSSFSELTYVYGQNFLEQAIVGTKKGAFTVDIQQNKAITSLFGDTSIRKLIAIDQSSFLVKPQKHSWTRVEGNHYDKANSFFSAKMGKRIPDSYTNFLKADSTLLLINKYEVNALEDDYHFYSISGQHIQETQIIRATNNLVSLTPLVEDHLRLAGITAGNYKCVVTFDIESAQFDTLGMGGEPVQLGDININNTLATSDGSLWIASTDGLFEINLPQETVHHYKDGVGFSDYRALVLHEMPNGHLWIGTVKGGIQVFDPKKGKVIQIIDSRNGLSNNIVPILLSDDDGDIWAGTFNGLNLISPEGTIKTRLFKKDGLPDNEFNRLAFDKMPDGRLLLGTINGLCIIDPKAVKKSLQSKVQQIYISEISYYDEQSDEVVSIANFENLDTPIELTADRRNIRIRVAMSNYGYSETNSFAYRLGGREDDWNYLGKQSIISLSNLPPGRYPLLINGIDERGNWAAEPISIELFVKDYFYKQAWFYVLCFLVLTIIAIAWIRYLQHQRILLRKEVAAQTRQIREDKAVIEQQAEELKQADELKSRFFTNISHELRTPITLIRTPVENLINKFGDQFSPTIRRSHQLIFQNAKKLGTLVEELLELSRIEAGKQKLNPTATNFTTFCRQLFSAFESGAQQKNIDYQLDIRLREDPNILIDRKRLSKIVNNLIGNALKFTSTNGNVTVLVSHFNPPKTSDDSKRQWFQIQVSDTGRGIPPEDLPYVFDRYFQTKRQDLPIDSGTGVGLALSKEIAELMNGKLTVESTWGRGSAFTFKFPALPVRRETPVLRQENIGIPQSETLPQPTAALSKTPNGKRQLLIVEDNLDMQTLLVDLLNGQYQLQLANNGQEAWNLISLNNEFVANLDLILSDVMMPEMDGYTLLQNIKDTPMLCQIPIIMLTARASEEDKLQALRMGIDDYLTKPFSANELLARINNLIHNYDQRRHFAKAEKAKLPNLQFEQQAPAEQIWLKELEQVTINAIEQQLKTTALHLAGMMSLSERQLRRRLKAATGLPIKTYINEVKLQKARQLLENKSFSTISEIAYASGFNTPGYFTQVYENRFGKRPGEYLGEG